MISVIIPAYNEEKLIARTLESLAHQKTKYQYEVVLVNNASSDSTEDIARTFLHKMPLRIVYQPEKGRGTARWLGGKVARGDILVSTDADVLIPSDWIEKIGGYFDDSHTMAITGDGKIVDNNAFTNFVFSEGLPILMRSYRVLVGHYWLSGFNFAVRKSLYTKVGGFNKRLNAAEDVDLTLKVRKVAKITFATDITITISGRRVQNNVLGIFFSYASTYLQLLFHRKRYAYLKDIR